MIKRTEGKNLVLKKEFKRKLMHFLENSCVLLFDMSARWETAMTLNQKKECKEHRKKNNGKKCIYQAFFLSISSSLENVNLCGHIIQTQI